jgi:hypothetical protein
MTWTRGRVLHVTDEYAFAADYGHTWTSVEGLRLDADGVERVVAEVAALVAQTSAQRCSWWLTERSTPDDLEERLLAAGLARYEKDYLHAAMLLTKEPPHVAGVEVRRIETFEEFAEARRLARDAFGNFELDEEDVAAEWEHDVDPTYAAWVDGRMASVGRATFTHVGAYLMGGATAEWARGRGAYRAVVRARWDAAVGRGTPALAVGAGPMSRPILERLGFEQALQFRRLESTR